MRPENPGEASITLLNKATCKGLKNLHVSMEIHCLLENNYRMKKALLKLGGETI